MGGTWADGPRAEDPLVGRGDAAASACDEVERLRSLVGAIRRLADQQRDEVQRAREEARRPVIGAVGCFLAAQSAAFAILDTTAVARAGLVAVVWLGVAAAVAVAAAGSVAMHLERVRPAVEASEYELRMRTSRAYATGEPLSTALTRLHADGVRAHARAMQVRDALSGAVTACAGASIGLGLAEVVAALMARLG